MVSWFKLLRSNPFDGVLVGHSRSKSLSILAVQFISKLVMIKIMTLLGLPKIFGAALHWKLKTKKGQANGHVPVGAFGLLSGIHPTTP